MNRLVVRYKYRSRCENLYCVAIVAHGWFLRIRDTFGGSSNGCNVQWVNLSRLDQIMMMST